LGRNKELYTLGCPGDRASGNAERNLDTMRAASDEEPLLC
jgi:hypothetical protein